MVISPLPNAENLVEKTGRWEKEEHLVFLQGLERHGKQWKLIANMIGTRTVVQVRTHAQKYFQKMERDTLKDQHPKRKSLPSSMPSRKKARSLRKSRTASVSLVSDMPLSPPPEL